MRERLASANAAQLIADLEQFRPARPVWDRCAEMLLVALHAGLRSRQYHPANFGSQRLCFFECILHVGRVHGDSGLEISHSPSCGRDRKRR